MWCLQMSRILKQGHFDAGVPVVYYAELVRAFFPGTLITSFHKVRLSCSGAPYSMAIRVINLIIY